MRAGVSSRLAAVGFELPPVRAAGNYRLAVRTGDYAVSAGHGPFLRDGNLLTGVIGADLDAHEGRFAAQQAVLSAIHSCGRLAGDTDQLRELVSMRVFVAGTDSDLLDVADAASEVVAVCFPDQEPPTRTVVACAALPLRVPVVIEISALADWFDNEGTSVSHAF